MRAVLISLPSLSLQDDAGGVDVDEDRARLGHGGLLGLVGC